MNHEVKNFHLSQIEDRIPTHPLNLLNRNLKKFVCITILYQYTSLHIPFQ